MAIRKYVENGITLFEVYVNARGPSGGRIQRKRRGIATLRKAQSIEFELRCETAEEKTRPSSYTFGDWSRKCL